MTTRGPPVHVHPTTRNLWGGPGSSSGSSRTYQEPHYSQPARTPSPQYDIIEGPRLNRPSGSSHSHTHSDSAVDPCGGHCSTFENFCHYFLQVLFIAGILTGVSLMIAGSVLRGQKRGGDLMVLVYIGCLTALVCTLLLSVQCCVRRDVKRRKRARGLRPPAPIPLHDLAPQAEPLVRHLITASQTGHNQRYIPESLIRGDCSGTPWWRRQPPYSCKLPHSHAHMPL